MHQQDTSLAKVKWDFEPIEVRLDQLEALQQLLASETVEVNPPAALGDPAVDAADVAKNVTLESDADAEQLSEREIEALSWSMLDGVIDKHQLMRLEEMLRSDDEAIKSYVECAVLHADLQQFFTPSVEH